MPTTIFLMRHGATEANLADPPRLQGRKRNSPLTRFGVLQARAAGERVAGKEIAACYCSPLLRTAQTAEIVADGLGLTPIKEEGLIECDVGAWEGLDWQSIRYFDAYNYSRFMDDPTNFGFPRGETFLQVHRRATRTFESILRRHTGESVLIVSHYAVNRVYLAGVEGLQLDQHAIAALDSGSISVVTHDDAHVDYRSLEAAPRDVRRAA
jgi:broad specificity phosphatase PhoE